MLCFDLLKYCILILSGYIKAVCLGGLAGHISFGIVHKYFVKSRYPVLLTHAFQHYTSIQNEFWLISDRIRRDGKWQSICGEAKLRRM